MKIVSTTTRISISLACLTVTAMFSASLLGLFPDERAERLRSRSRLIESVAVHFCGVARKVDATAVGKILADLIARNPDLISIGIRRPDGQY
ncbi:MAG: hypothetical protein ACK58T_13445, partial [Phycisphaerae bacterium]